ncbi:YTH domain-containing protein ECT2-like isoform X2 [Nicotiana tomentosiformis]|uniref:YTH domain-containing protein ECT2-like isoform X2 n=1 Tax=Nicotiana tomentosiformis TaxID=4098 RepID=UPI00388C658E
MAAGAPPVDQAAGLLQNLSLDSQNRNLEITEPKKKPSVDSKDVGNGQIQSMNRSVTPLLPEFIDPNFCYLPNGYPSTAAYYYGYDASGNEWEDYSRYLNPDGVEMAGFHHPRPSSGMNTTNGYMNRMYPNKLYGGRYCNTFGTGMGFGSNGYDTRTTGRGWMTVDNKFKPRGRGNSFYGNENMDGLNELNRGPRGKGFKNQKGFTPVTLAVKGQNVPLTLTNDAEKEKPSLIPDREQYNCPDFPVTYTDAKFFIIKSYSEDDVHKSIKYNVWASTPNGNKKLDSAYQEAKQKSGGCPVFLFFSVNTSGQFVGVAEMVGPVDFNKSLEYWQQDKWIGCFPVKWHIVKDVPNSLLKNITLENNENKPVTNSRDTQEVKIEQGLQVIKIFKDHISKQCILDDFEFYEDRQKRIQEKKVKQQLFQKQSQVWEGKATEEKKKENTKVEPKSQKPSEVPAGLNKESLPAAPTNGEVKLTENGSVTKGDDMKGAKPVTVAEKKPVAKGIAKGVANGC